MTRILFMLCIVCAISTTSHAMKIKGESLVLAGTEAGRLMCADIVPGSVVVHSSYLAGTTYENGRDYIVDPKAGTIARTADSRIPDFSKNVLYGKEDFDHSSFPGYGNAPFSVFVDYESNSGIELTSPINYADQLKKTGEKLRAGKTLKIIAFGDSITAGGEASQVSLQFPERYGAYLREKFPDAKIVVENGATGGDTTREGLARLKDKVLTRSPDLVFVAFGMNDHNIGSVPIPEYKANLKQMIDRIREGTGADVILLSAFPPNPKWHFSSHQMDKYAVATKEVADAEKTAYADVFGVWERVLKRKDAPSLLGNNINHPSDFGHWLYLQALEAVNF